MTIAAAAVPNHWTLDATRDQERSKDRLVARRTLDEAVLRAHVAHPDQDPYITAIFSLIAPALAVWRSVPLPGSLETRARVDVGVDPSSAARMIDDVGKALGVCRPDVFFLPEHRGDYALMNLQREQRLSPTMVLFADVLECREQSALAFVIGRAMAYLYHPHFCAVAVDGSAQALRQVLRACLYWGGQPVAEGDADDLRLIGAEILGRMRPAQKEQLAHVLRRAIEAGPSLDTERWMKAAEHTACRLGLLMAGDLRGAVGALEKDWFPLWGPGPVGVRQLRFDLLRYAVSEDCFIARRAMGMDVTMGAAGR